MTKDKPIKLLINLVNLDSHGVQIIWLTKFKKIESLGCKITINGGNFLKPITLQNQDVYDFNLSLRRLLENKSLKNISKFGYIFYSLKKNYISYKSIKKIKQQQFDVVYSPSAVLDLVLIPYFLKKRQPKIVWVSVFDNTVLLRGTGNKIVRFLAWWFFQISIKLLRHADKIYAVTPELKHYLLKRGFSEKQVVVTGNAVEDKLIRAAKPSQDGAVDAIFMGRVNEKKGIYDLLAVLSLVVEKIPDFRLGLIGEGDKPTEANLRTAIKKLGLENNVVFYGYVVGQKKYDLIKSAKIFWFFSHDESFGVALLEGVCCGKPALAYDLSPYKEIYQCDEVTTFSFGDFSAIAKETLRIFKEKDFINSGGLKLLDHYSWQKIATLEFNSFKNLDNLSK